MPSTAVADDWLGDALFQRAVGVGRPMDPLSVLLGGLLMVGGGLLRSLMVGSPVGDRDHAPCVEGGLLLLHWKFEGEGHT